MNRFGLEDELAVDLHCEQHRRYRAEDRARKAEHKVKLQRMALNRQAPRSVVVALDMVIEEALHGLSELCQARGDVGTCQRIRHRIEQMRQEALR